MLEIAGSDFGGDIARESKGSLLLPVTSEDEFLSLLGGLYCVPAVLMLAGGVFAPVICFSASFNSPRFVYRVCCVERLPDELIVVVARKMSLLGAGRGPVGL